MTLLKKENWFIWVILLFITQGISNVVLGVLLEVFDKDAWYAKWQYWVIGFVFLLAPFFVMLLIFSIQITCQTAKKLGVSGSSLYLSPYVWILLIIIPVFGWILLLVMMIYLEIMIFVNLKNGSGEKYIN